MVSAQHNLGFFLFRMAALCMLCLPVPAMAATTDFNSGAAAYVIGNPITAGNVIGIGGTSSTPTNNANASGNVVNVTGGTVNSGIYGGFHRTNDSAYASAMGNTVNVGPAFAGKATDFWVYGGYAQVMGAGGTSAVASGNSVNINGGSFYHVFGGSALNNGGSTVADNNTVHFASGTTTNIHGGYASGSTSSGVTSASGNRVIISGGTVTGTVYGGQTSSGTNRTVANNTVTILGNPDLSSAVLYGGYIGNSSAAAGSGNTLEVKTSGVAVRQISGFQNLHFFLPDSVGDQDTVLTVNNAAFIGGATVYVGMKENNSPLQIGNTVTLIQGTLNGSPANSGGLGMQGISKAYTFEINTVGNNRLTATVLGIEKVGDGGRVDAQLKSLDESRMAGLALLTQGQDLLEARAIPHLRRLAPQTRGAVAFGVTGGGLLRYNTGSHVDVKSFSLLTGIGWNAPLHAVGTGNALLGAFFETGQGGYDTRNAFNSIVIKGHGNTHYYGGGVLGRYDSAPLNGAGLSGNVYLEAALRAGRVDTRYKSSDIMTASLNDVDCDSSAAYYGLHAGIGYIWNVTKASSLDLYSKYLWTRQSGDSVTVEGDSIHFKGVDSQRWRNGVRFSHELGTDSGRIFIPYVGAAYEYEFDSKARSASNGRAVPVPDVKGATGVGEIGFRFRPSAASGFFLDLGMQGYTGKREGGGGSVLAVWEF